MGAILDKYRDELAEDLKTTFVKRSSDTDYSRNPLEVVQEVSSMLSTDISTYVEKILQNMPSDEISLVASGAYGLITSTSEEEATDNKAFSSLRTQMEISNTVREFTRDLDNRYISKTNSDTAEGLITFNKGIQIGTALITWDAVAGALKITESVYSDKEVSAYGGGATGGGGTGSSSLGGLVNVGVWADEVPLSDRIMVQLTGDTHWSSKLLSEVVGLDTVALGDYLTANNYVTKTYVDDQIDTKTHTHENKSTLDLITQNHLDLLSHLSLVEGRIKVDVDFWSTGEISAYGSGTGGGGGSGLITSVLGSAGLGGSYLDSDLTNTFNAYTINLINTNLTSALSRIGALETSTSNVTWGTPTSQYVPLSVNSVANNLSLDGHVHTFASLSVKPTTLVGYGITDALASNGNAASATKLANIRGIWGQNFDGTGNVSGTLSMASSSIDGFAGNISFAGNFHIDSKGTQDLYLNYSNGTKTIINGGSVKGNVGIGTTNPRSQLSFGQSAFGKKFALYEGEGDGSYFYGIGTHVNGSGVAGLGLWGGTESSLPTIAPNIFISRNLNGGYVGIGTDNPSALLDIYGQVNATPATSGTIQSGARLRLGRWDGAVLDFGSVGSSGLWLQATNGTDLSLKYPILMNPNGGNILIGTTTNGNYKLDVNGNAHFSSGSKFRNVCIEVDASGNSEGHDSEINCYNSSLAIQYNTPNNLHLCQGGGNVAVGGVVNTGDRLSVFGAFRVVGSSYISSSLSVDGNSTLRGITLSNGVNTPRNMTVGSNGGIQISGLIDSFTYSLPTTIGWYRVAVAPVGIERPFGQFDISWTLSGYHGAVSLTAGMMYASAPFISQSAYTNFGLSITKARIVYHTTYSGNYAYLEVYNSSAQAVSLTVKGYNLYNWSIYSASTVGSIPSGYSNKEISLITGYMTSGNVVALGEITAYAASDRRLKMNIVPLSDSLRIIESMNPVSYKWNSIARELNPMKGSDRDFGLIAQELESIMPELVHTIYGEYKSIDYVKIIPHLICAIKQLKVEVDNLKNNNVICV